MSEPAFIPEIEQEVLGTLLSGAPMNLVAPHLEQYHFLHPAHQLIYEACTKANSNYSSCSMSIVSKLIDEQAFWGAIKGETSKGEYLAHMISNVVFGRARLHESCKKVVEQWARVTLADALNSHAEACNDNSADIRSVSIQIGETVDDIMTDVRKGIGQKTRHTIFDAANDGLRAADEARRNKGVTGITWGLSDVDRLTGGIQKRDLTLIAARPSIGKTSVAMSCALSAAKAGHSMALISLEMDAQKVALRALSDFCYDRNLRIPYADMIKGKLSDSDIENLTYQAGELSKVPLIIEDQAGLRMSDIRVKIERLIEDGERAGKPISGIIIDHLGLIKPSGRYSGNRVNEITEISAGLKTFAREYDLAIIALSQLSRAVETRENKRPMLSDLRDSGSIEQDADTVIFLYREAYYLERDKKQDDRDVERVAKLDAVKNDLDFIIAKQRNGQVTTVELFADMAYSAVRCVAKGG